MTVLLRSCLSFPAVASVVALVTKVMIIAPRSGVKFSLPKLPDSHFPPCLFSCPPRGEAGGGGGGGGRGDEDGDDDDDDDKTKLQTPQLRRPLR